MSKLTLGPVLFNWSPEAWRDFYFGIADEAPIDVVYVGEVVCWKRTPFFAQHLPAVVERLQAAGKEVVLSTLALIMNKREMASVRDAAQAAGDIPVEANDISACALLAGKPHVVGPFVNVFNEGTAAYLVRRGAMRLCLPVELDARAIGLLPRATGAQIEVQVFGRLPLAVSARCYHARSHGLTKDNCRYVCAEDPDGMDLETVDGEPFLAINGIQTMSYTYANLSAEIADLQAVGVSHFRLWPHSCDMIKVAETFRELLEGRISATTSNARLKEITGNAAFSNGYYHGVEGAAYVNVDVAE